MCSSLFFMGQSVVGSAQGFIHITLDDIWSNLLLPLTDNASVENTYSEL